MARGGGVVVKSPPRTGIGKISPTYNLLANGKTLLVSLLILPMIEIELAKSVKKRHEVCFCDEVCCTCI